MSRPQRVRELFRDPLRYALLLVMVFALGLQGCRLRFGDSEEPLDPVQMTFCIHNLDSATAGALSGGGECRFRVSGALLGEVDAANISLSPELVESRDGQGVPVYLPSSLLWRLTFTVRTEGRFTETGFFWQGGTRMSPNMSFDMVFCALNATIYLENIATVLAN